MNVPVFDLKKQYAELRDGLLPALDEIMAQGNFILGDNVRSLEDEIARYTGTTFGIGVANGSDALNLALMPCGVGPGDEVLVPSFTFFATAGAVARTGATPVFKIAPGTVGCYSLRDRRACGRRGVLIKRLTHPSYPGDTILNPLEGSMRPIGDNRRAGRGLVDGHPHSSEYGMT